MLVDFDQQGIEAAERVVSLNDKFRKGLTVAERAEFNVLADMLAYKIVATKKVKEAFGK